MSKNERFKVSFNHDLTQTSNIRAKLHATIFDCEKDALIFSASSYHQNELLSDVLEFLAFNKGEATDPPLNEIFTRSAHRDFSAPLNALMNHEEFLLPDPLLSLPKLIQGIRNSGSAISQQDTQIKAIKDALNDEHKEWIIQRDCYIRDRDGANATIEYIEREYNSGSEQGACSYFESILGLTQIPIDLKSLPEININNNELTISCNLPSLNKFSKRTPSDLVATSIKGPSPGFSIAPIYRFTVQQILLALIHEVYASDHRRCIDCIHAKAYSLNEHQNQRVEIATIKISRETFSSQSSPINNFSLHQIDRNEFSASDPIEFNKGFEYLGGKFNNNP